MSKLTNEFNILSKMEKGSTYRNLFEEGYEYLEKDLSRAMIEQGLQEIESEDALLILSFWREYLEENNLATIIPDDRLH